MNIIELRKVAKVYRMGGLELHALDDISLDIAEGEFVSIMGASGSGKSTLLHILGLLDKSSAGSYKLADKEISLLSDDELASLRNKFMGFIFQNYNLLTRMSAKENVALPKVYFSGKNLLADETAMLKKVGLGDRIRHKPNELSGGQQQRVAIARALINNPLLILADEPTGNLDTSSAAEIISILKELNNSGITIVMVTHELNLAREAGRILMLQDGKIIADEKMRPSTVVKTKITGNKQLNGSNLTNKIFKLKRIKDYFIQAMRSLFSNKTRSILSIVGVLIGVSSLIAMLALGRGAQEQVKKNISSLGSNILMVSPAMTFRGGIAMQSGSATRLTVKDSEEIRGIPGVTRVAAYANGNAQVVYGGKNWNTRVIGTTIDYTLIKNSVPDKGRFFEEEENVSRQKIAVLGRTVARELFGSENPIGEYIKINKVDFQVIGTFPKKGSMGFTDQDDEIVIPLNTAMYRLLGTEFIDSIDVHVQDTQLMDIVSSRVKKLIVMLHRLPESKEDTVDIKNMAEIQATITSTINTFTLLLGGIAFISLLVGGIGIMNIMLVSVTERTREIGLRKAIGANNKDILFQFVIESIVICVVGGIMGIIFGSSLSVVFSQIAGWSTSVGVSSVLLAFIFSFFIGLVFGLWPAKKASELNPIDALRYE